MIQQQVYILNTFLMVADALCIIVSAYAAYYADLFFLEEYTPLNGYFFLITILSVMFVNNYFMGRFHLYSEISHPTMASLVQAIFKSVAVDFVLLTAAVFLLGFTEFSKTFLWIFAFYTFLIILVVRVSVRFYVTKISRDGYNSRKILVVGDSDRGKLVTSALENQLSWGHAIVGHLNVGASKDVIKQGDEAAALLQQLKTKAIDEVLFVLTRTSTVDLNQCLNICRKMGVPARILPSLWTPEGNTLTVEEIQNIPFLNLRVDNFDAQCLMWKRLLDGVGVIVGVSIFFSLYPFVAIAIKLDSPGPVLFGQQRKGKHGRTFKLYKFRTMCQDAEGMKDQLREKNEMKGHMFKLTEDPRITRVGRFLRETSIDEIPQFINVIKGEMSLVGTRPPTLDEVEKYQPEHLKRISAKPGITGMWQVSGRNRIKDFDKVVELDCQYLDTWSLWGDIKIIFKTVFVVLQRKGAV
nr:sugar transferase [Desulfobulbaceae bacterium]